MRLGKDLENKPIISLSDGQILGRTKDVYVDQELNQLAGLFVGTEGVIRRKDRVIPNDRIVLFGIDVIIVKDADVITTTKALPETSSWRRLTNLHGKEVHTPGGTKLAILDDVVLDERGIITGFSLSRVYVTGPLAEHPFIPRDVVVNAFHNSDALLVDLPQLEKLSTDEDAPQNGDLASGNELLTDPKLTPDLPDDQPEAQQETPAEG